MNCTWLLILYLGKPVMLPVCPGPGEENQPAPSQEKVVPVIPPQEMFPIIRKFKRAVEA